MGWVYVKIIAFPITPMAAPFRGYVCGEIVIMLMILNNKDVLNYVC